MMMKFRRHPYGSWWEFMDYLSHTLPFLPMRLRNWICDKYDQSLEDRLPPTKASVMARQILKEDDR